MMKVTNNMITMDIEGSCSMQGVSEEVSTREFNKENEALVCNAIKSRKNVKRAMKSLSMPSIFWKLYVTCFILFSAAAGISITEHVLFVNIFNELADQVDTIAHQSDEYRCITESASITMQMASVSEYDWSHKTRIEEYWTHRTHIRRWIMRPHCSPGLRRGLSH
ncbi:MAG: hypothetical protein P4M11_04050 [Candidatus Pacebacteria bacterium]|nr:hypothetical protein [Candidatus Paceibacterota bacterium]